MPYYLPGQEPDEIRAGLYRFLRALLKDYPEKTIALSEWNDKKFGKALSYYKKTLGYEFETDLLDAYGFTVLQDPSDERQTAYREDEDKIPKKRAGAAAGEKRSVKKSGQRKKTEKSGLKMKILYPVIALLLAAAAAAMASIPGIFPRNRENNLPAPTPEIATATEEPGKPLPTPIPTAAPENAPVPDFLQEERTVILQQGAEGEKVTKVQLRLNELGFFFGLYDGDYGTMTTEAVKQFQAANGLETTGDLSSDEMMLLFPETEDEPSQKQNEKALMDKYLALTVCSENSEVPGTYKIIFSEQDDRGGIIGNYSFAGPVSPGQLGESFAGGIPSWFYPGAVVRVEALGNNSGVISSCNVTKCEPEGKKFCTGLIFPSTGSHLYQNFTAEKNSVFWYCSTGRAKYDPVLSEWEDAVVTDSVAEYLNDLLAEGCSISVTAQNREEYPDYDLYETYFSVSHGSEFWEMSLSVQKYGDRVEFELAVGPEETRPDV